MNWFRSTAASWIAGDSDLSTPAGRSRERLRRIGLTTLANVAARGIGFATAFFTVPLTLHYLGSERYGMWSTLSTVIALAGFADIGLGNGLLNALARAHGLQDTTSARRQVSTALVVLIAIAASLAVAFAIAYGYVDWARLFNVRSLQAQREAGPATAVFVACFLINLPLAIVAKVRQAYQEGYKTSYFDAGGNVLGLILVILAIRAQAPLVWLVAAMAGTPAVASLAHAAVLFGRDRPWLRIRFREYDTAVARTLFQHGLLFFALQLAGALFYAPDNLILAHLRDPETVARYAVAAKLFGIPMLLADVVLGPVWPAYREAMARGDDTWVRRTLLNSVRIAAAATAVVALGLVVGGNVILTAWVGPEVTAPALLLVGLGVWAMVGAVGTAVAMYLNAANLIRVQVVCLLVMIPLSVAFKIELVARWGAAGLPWGLTAAYLVFVAVPLAVLAKRGRLSPT